MQINGIDLSELDPLDTIVEQEVGRFLSLSTPGCAALEGAWYWSGPRGPQGGSPSVRAVAVGGLLDRIIDPRSLEDPAIDEYSDRDVRNLQRVLDFFQVDDVPGLAQVLDVADRLLVGRRGRRVKLQTFDLYAWLLAWRSA